jgi:hypothetical protein
MKKYLLVVVAIVALVVMASGCTSQTGNNTTATKTYSANGISFNYSSNWDIINETTNENGTVIALGDADIQQNNSVKGNGVSIIKIPKTANSTADLADLKSQFASLNGTNSTISIAGVTANVTTFNTQMNNVTAQIKIIDFEKNNYIYLIQYATIASDFQIQEQLFETITKSLQVT